MDHGAMTNGMKKEGMLEYFLTVERTHEAHEATSERNTCIEPYCEEQDMEDPATPNYIEMKTKYIWGHIHHLTTQQLYIDTKVSQYMSILSCRVML